MESECLNVLRTLRIPSVFGLLVTRTFHNIQHKPDKAEQKDLSAPLGHGRTFQSPDPESACVMLQVGDSVLQPELQSLHLTGKRRTMNKGRSIRQPQGRQTACTD